MEDQAFYLNLNPVNFFIISGVVQNFILAGILFFKRGNNSLANIFLGLAVITVNLHLTYLMMLDTNLDNLFPGLLWMPYSYLSATGPLIFFYVKAHTIADFKASHIPFYHFFPVLIEFAFQILLSIDGIRYNRLVYNTPFYFYITPLIYTWAAVSIFYYLRLSIQLINKHEDWALKNFSNLQDITLKWLQKLMTYYRLLWVVWVPFVAAFLLFFRFQLQYLFVVLTLYLLMFVLTYLTYWIGLEGFRHTHLVLWRSEGHKKVNKNYGQLSNTEIQRHIDRILQLMTVEKIYLRESLNLREFAAELGADPNLVSHILNNHLESNFHDFTNKYRIEEAKRRLQDPAFQHLTILAIALESGFNSKTTFNRVFKNYTGLTPSTFKKVVNKSPE